jgi:fibronectin type 3 domain-containing protein
VTGATIAIVGLSAQAARAQAPASPTARFFTATTGSVSVTLNAVTGATSYNVYRATTAGAEGSTPYVSGLTTTTYTDTAVTNGTKYYYQFTAVNANGESAKSGEYSTIPLAATAVTVTTGNASAGLTWAAVSQATGYKIYRSTSTGTEVLVNSTAATSFVDTGLTNGTTYYYKVTAYYSNSSESAKSAEVSVMPSASVLAAPVLSANTTSTTVGLMWTSVGGTSYTVYRSTTTSGPYTAIGTTTGTNYTDTPPLTTTDYYYVVTASSGSAQSLNSNEVLANVTNGVSLTDTADTYVAQGSPTGNFGQSTSLVDTGKTGLSEVSYVTFDLRGTTGSITNATFKLYKNSHDVAETVTVYGISPSSWSELGTTWNTAPSLTGATVVGTLAIGAGVGYYTCDVTSYLQAQKAAGATSVSFAIAGNSTAVTAYFSREYPINIPRLTVLATATTIASGLVATPGEQQVLLTWQPVQNATGYNVYRSTSSGGTYTKITTTAPSVANAYIDTGRTNGTTYYYYVKAIVGGVEGTASALASAAPLAQDTYWTVTPPSNRNSPTPSMTANTSAFSIGHGTTLMTSATVVGPVSSSTSTQSQAACSGTWTFTWTGSSWPSLYTITRLQKQIYAASVNAGNGSASVANTGSNTLVSATWPTSASAILAVPAVTATFNTADLNTPSLSSATNIHIAGPMTAPGTTTGAATGWSENINNLTSTVTGYTTPWFQSRFSSPSAIVLTFTVPSSDITVNANLTSAISTGSSVGQSVIEDIFGGQ